MYRIVLDSETVNTIENENGSLDMSNVLFYDCGWIVLDCETENVIKAQSFVNSDIFFQEPELMNECFFANKIPQYRADIKSGERKLATTYEIRKALLEDCLLYDISEIWCHNAFFDWRALNNTQRWVTKSRWRYFFPWGVTIYDSLKTSRQVFGADPNYIAYCEEHGYLTKRGQPRLTAEILYRYITGNESFEESHTGLEDCLIEGKILMECLKRNPEVNGRLFKERE